MDKVKLMESKHIQAHKAKHGGRWRRSRHSPGVRSVGGLDGRDGHKLGQMGTGEGIVGLAIGARADSTGTPHVVFIILAPLRLRIVLSSLTAALGWDLGLGLGSSGRR